MATKYELRTFKDIQDAVLEELGESRSNTKLLNRIKRDINIVYLDEVVADHNFIWLKDKVEVQTEPYFSTGTASVSANSPSVTLTESPAKSYKGYNFSVDGYSEVNRILSHSANSSTIVLESPFSGTTNSAASFKIWSDFVPLPADTMETLEVSHAYASNPLEARGPQEFERMVSMAPRAQARPRAYCTGEKRQPDKYESVSSLPATATRSASGLVRTIVFASSLGADEDSALIRPGNKIEVTGSGGYTYNGEAVVAELTTTTNTNDTIKYTVEENITESSTADTGITVKVAPQDAKLYEYRPLFFYPSLYDSRTTLRVQRLIEPEPLINDTDEPLIPIQDRVVLLYGALSRGWVKARDEQTADRNLGLFGQKLGKMVGKTKDGQDKPRIVVSSEYARQKRRRGRGSSIPALHEPIGGGSSSQVSGTANRVAVFNSIGSLVSDSAISITELQTLDGIESNIQDQLDTKLGSQGATTDNAVPRWDGTDGTGLNDSGVIISDLNAVSGLTALDVDNINIDGNTISSTDTNGNITLTPDGSGKVQVSNFQVTDLSTGIAHVDADGDVTSSAIVNADVDAAAAIDYSKLSLTDSIVDADVDSAAAISRAKLAAGTAGHVVVNDGTTGAFSSAASISIAQGGTGQATATAAFDALAPTTTAGDLIVHNGTDNVRFPVGSDGQVIVGDSTQTAGIKWAAAPSGNINWIAAVDRDAESTTFNWNEYVDAAGASPEDGTGEASTPDIAISRTTVAGELIRGSGSYKIAKPASDEQGEGVSVAFTIDPGYYENPKMQTVKFRYQASADFSYGTDPISAPSDIVVYIYDVTNATLIQPTPWTLDGSGEFVGQFQPAYNSGSYRLILHVATTNASAWDFFFDDVEVGPSAVAHGFAATDMASYTPSVSGFSLGNGTQDVRWSRLGDKILIQGVYDFGSTSSFSGTFEIGLPNGVTLVVLNAGNGFSHAHGAATSFDSSTGSNETHTSVYPKSDGTALLLRGGSGGQINNTVPFTWADGDRLSFTFIGKVEGWSSNTVMSSDADTRVVAMETTSQGGQAPTVSAFDATADIVWTSANFDTNDTHGAFDGTTYTVPVPGWYDVDVGLQLSGTEAANDSVGIRLYKNGSIDSGTNDRIQASGLSATYYTYSRLRKFDAGDEITVRISTNLASPTLAATASVPGIHYFSIKRVSGPATIAASEKVYCHYTVGDTDAIGTSLTDVIYDTKVRDTHGAFNTTTGEFTAPRPDTYCFSWCVTSAAVALTTAQRLTTSLITTPITHNGSRSNGTGGTVQHASGGSVAIYLQAGETAKVQAISSSATTLDGSDSTNYFSITSQGGI